MANGADKPNSDGKLRDSELIGWLFGFLLFAAVVGGIFQALQNSFGGFGNDGMGVGATVAADGDIDVWELPGAGEIRGTQTDGARGEVIDGPVIRGRTEWWYIDFENDPDGWVDVDDVRVRVPAFEIGDVIEMIRTAGVWEQAGGGTSGGLQFAGALGELVGGPRVFGGERWWDVDFEDDSDGWVRESDFQHAPSGIARLWNSFIDYILLPSVILSVLLIASLVVLSVRVRKIVVALKEKYQTPPTAAFVQSKEEREQKNERWERVQQLVSSTEPGNWRLAILEADIILNDIVGRMGYEGESLGDRLKQVEKSDFITLDKAWEAHKIRNTIAHEGGDFILTQREARRVISLYEDVFSEFHYI